MRMLEIDATAFSVTVLYGKDMVGTVGIPALPLGGVKEHRVKVA